MRPVSVDAAATAFAFAALVWFGLLCLLGCLLAGYMCVAAYVASSRVIHRPASVGSGTGHYDGGAQHAMWPSLVLSVACKELQTYGT